MSAVNELHFVAVSQHDPLAQPLLAELSVEYSARYGGTAENVLAWLTDYPATEFAAPGGGLYDSSTAAPDCCAPCGPYARMVAVAGWALMQHPRPAQAPDGLPWGESSR